MTADEVRALADAARLELPEGRVERIRAMLELVLREADELGTLPIDDLEPLLDAG